MSIDYSPTDIDKSMKFVQNLVQEMTLSGQDTAGKNVHQMTIEVKRHLKEEQQMDELIELISVEETRSEAMSKTIRYVPCILHCKNRWGIKFLELLSIEGLLNAQAGHIQVYDTANSSIKERENAYIKKFEDEINTRILGSDECKTQFQVPLDKPKGRTIQSIVVINIENYWVRKIIDETDSLI